MPVPPITAYAPLKPEYTEMALKTMNDEMLKACETIDGAKLDDFKQVMLKNHETQLKENSYWYGIIGAYANRGLDNCTGYEDIVKAQTPETIAAFARLLMSAGNKIEVVMTPEE